MLKLYRQNLDEFSVGQVNQFNLMMPAEKMELLFMMIMNTNKILQYVHGLSEPEEAETVAMPKLEGIN